MVEPGIYINNVEKYSSHRTLLKAYKTLTWPQELNSIAFQDVSATDSRNSYNNIVKKPIEIMSCRLERTDAHNVIGV